ncbi:MAG: hypothetical protein MUF00_10985 [Gemmatimonadaceae bacterium]|jgi:regulation of enolase protein 1 (concanavalin A-like superfamily)|nr:hypothetical protein [Gemmatimonadaceae bacterium]
MLRSAFRATLVSAAIAIVASSSGAQLRPGCSGFGSRLSLDFASAKAGTIADVAGRGTGLLDRLTGTGTALPVNDPNLALDTNAGLLRIRSTNSDLNGQLGLGTGEYLGANLSRLGFTGSQDFCVSTRLRDIRYSELFDQFGLYVGASGASAFRAGHFATVTGRRLFSVSTFNGSDVGLADTPGPSEGSDLNLTIGRLGGAYFFDVNGFSTALGLQPTWLNGTGALNVGLFAANARNNNSKTMTVDEFTVAVNTTVVPEPSSLLLILSAGLALLCWQSTGDRLRASRSGGSRD